MFVEEWQEAWESDEKEKEREQARECEGAAVEQDSQCRGNGDEPRQNGVRPRL